MISNEVHIQLGGTFLAYLQSGSILIGICKYIDEMKKNPQNIGKI